MITSRRPKRENISIRESNEAPSRHGLAASHHNGFDILTNAVERPLSRSDLLRLIAGAISAAALSNVGPRQSRADVFLQNDPRPNASAKSLRSPKEVHLFDFLSPAQKRAARRGLAPDVTAELKNFFNAVGQNGVFIIDPYQYAFEISNEENNPLGSFSGVANYTLRATGAVLHDKRDDYHVDADKDEQDSLEPVQAYKHNPTFLEFRGCESITVEGLSVTTQRGDLVDPQR